MENETKEKKEEIREAEVKEIKKKKCNDCEKYKRIIFIMFLLVVAVGGYVYYKYFKDGSQIKGVMTQAEAKSKVEDFINNSLMQPGTKAEIGEPIKEMGMFKVPVKIGEGDQKQEIETYISLDGKKFFPSAPMDVDDTKQKIADERKKESEPENIPKTNKPKVDLYVMSFCPFGNKAEDTMKPVYDLLKNKVDFNFYYIVNSEGDKISSLHGEPEVLQNEREACVLKDNGKDKWFEFVSYINKNCGSDGNCWETGAKSVGLNAQKISACVTANGSKLMKDNEKKSSEVGATGSPTMKINETETKVVYKYGNSEEYKKAICGAFENAPEECAKVLGESVETSEGGSCN